MLKYRKYLFLLKNKYFLVFLFMAFWLLFFDNNNLIHRVKSNIYLHELKSDKEYYLEKISETRQMKQELLTNKRTLEKFAREKYHMKKDDEEIFLVE